MNRNRRMHAANLLSRAMLHLVDRSCVDGMSIPNLIAICQALEILSFSKKLVECHL